MYLFIEGVNLTQAIFDTDDLSTVRGSSMILETLGCCAEANFDGAALLEEGASRALLKFSDDKAPTDDAIQRFLKSEPWCHFTLTYGVGLDPEAAESKARHRQLRQWTVPVSAFASGHAPDALNQTYAASEKNSRHGVGIKVSQSVKIRREAGQELRPWLYQTKGLKPPKSFEDIIVAANEQTRMVTDAKLAVVCADGIGGTILRKSFEEKFKDDPDEGRIAFNTAMKNLRQRLAEALEKWLIEEGLFHIEESKFARPQFDVLIWGGDDMAFVMPAEYLMGFLKVFFETVDAKFDAETPDVFENGFPHRVGCVVANYKTPIRQMRALAGHAEALVKTALSAKELGAQSGFSIDVFESSALPYSGPVEYRQALYGTGYTIGDDLFLASDVDSISKFCQATMDKDDPAGLTTSQAYKALRKMRRAGAAVSSKGSNDICRDVLNSKAERVSGAKAPCDDWITAFSEVPRALPMLLAQVAQIGPYCTKRVQPQKEDAQ